MKVKKGFGEVLFDIVNIALLIIISLVMLYPFWHELCLSLSSSAQATRGGIFLAPREFSTAAYVQVMKNPFIWTTYANSIFCAVVTTFAGVLFTAMLAYGLSKHRLPGNKVLSFLVVFCMIFQGGMIPTYLTVKSLNLIDTLWALILLAIVTPYNTIIMKNFFSSMPNDLEEAASIDGAGPLRIFFQIMLPLAKAVLATVGLWLAVASWNNFQGPLIYINSRSNLTLPLYIRQVIDGQLIARTTGEVSKSAVESVVGATIIVSLVPILCVYPFLQKYFVKGVMIGSVKG